MRTLHPYSYIGYAVLFASLAACDENHDNSPVDANPGVDSGMDGGMDSPTDAGAGTYVLSGVAGGIQEAVQIELTHVAGTEVLTTEVLDIDEDGAFTSETRFVEGSSYAVALVGSPACIVEPAEGTFADADIEISLACHDVATLTTLTLSGSASPLDFSPDRYSYVTEAPFVQQEVVITATAADPASSIVIADTPSASDALGEPLPLNLGDNEIHITVYDPSGVWRTYQVTIHRASEIVQYIYGKASNTGADDRFGASVALSGDILVVGASSEDSLATGIDGDQDNNDSISSGAVFVFQRTGTSWVQEAYIKASNTNGGDAFGASVALSGDTLVVGAPLEASAAKDVDGDETNNAAPGSGAAYVFRHVDGTWVQEAYLKASNTGAQDNFGISVALSGDILAVGAPREDSISVGINPDQQDDDRAPDSGTVYVFRRSQGVWVQEAFLKASNTSAGDLFGFDIASHGDVLAVGAFQEDSAATGVDGDQANDDVKDSGAVYVFRRTPDGWTQEAYIKASNTDQDDGFGISVAVHANTLAVGAYNEDSIADPSGAAYVFRRVGGVWAQEAHLKISDADTGDRFGIDVAVWGNLVAVGSDREDSIATGIDGDPLSNGASNSGAVYMFRRGQEQWAQEFYIKASNGETQDSFGFAMALASNNFIVGAYAEDSEATGIDGDESSNNAPFSGAIYGFH